MTTGPIHELARAWSIPLQLAMGAYADAHALPLDALLRVDAVLILLRIADSNATLREQALERVAELTGKAITRCPSAMPPWPPRPVARHPVQVVATARANDCSENTDMHRRYDIVKVGMTREQLLSRGVTVRDISVWVRQGRITFREEMRMRA